MAWKDGMKAVSKAEHSDVEQVEKWVALMADTTAGLLVAR